MSKKTHKIVRSNGFKTYVFRVMVEPDEDRWRSYCPLLEHRGAATWGYTKKEALQNIREVLEMVVQSMVEHGERIPDQSEVQIFSEPRVAVTI